MSLNSKDLSRRARSADDDETRWRNRHWRNPVATRRVFVTSLLERKQTCRAPSSRLVSVAKVGGHGSPKNSEVYISAARWSRWRDLACGFSWDRTASLYGGL